MERIVEEMVTNNGVKTETRSDSFYFLKKFYFCVGSSLPCTDFLQLRRAVVCGLLIAEASLAAHEL